ncbi:hypothetical protein [Bartonella choladocola]|uniref:Uncharacterized protein n=1 Tax=Bartonella choladocola TaxID=2750995 RepID=A0A1U9MJH5_9HYPH|nr:hypothetical protein [Bartonella choladocola]AQT47870.1 hypothetical protein BBC0122_017710 [Bartonella choladocola]
MPSNTNTDKQIDNLEQASEADEKFIAFKKRMFRLGVFFLIVAIALSLPNYFFLETSNNILGVGIFSCVGLADIFILLPAIITKETNWLVLLGSTILCIVFLCLSVFYPFQDFQYRLKVISLVAIVATLLFVALNGWINAAFFPLKNADIRQSVDFASNRFAVDVLNVTLILGTLFGTIAFLYFYPGQDNSTFFGGIDIKNVALATAGLVTFFWAAKATKNKSIELEEKKQDGKRHDNEIAMVKRRDTAQLIAEASKLLSSESDAQKYAGLSFLNAVASDPEGPLREEAFNLIADFITGATDITTANKARLRAILYADQLVENNPHHFYIDGYIIISRTDCDEPDDDVNYLNEFEIKNLYVSYIGLAFGYGFIQRVVKPKSEYQFGFLNCIFYGANPGHPLPTIEKIATFDCHFRNCKIRYTYAPLYTLVENPITGKIKGKRIVPKKHLPDNNDSYNTFYECDFSDCLTWIYERLGVLKSERKVVFDKCYYYPKCEPKGFKEDDDEKLLTKITSEKQFNELMNDPMRMHYSPPDDKK